MLHTDILPDYSAIYIFFAIAFVLASVIILLAKILSPSRPDAEKLSPYECGFEAFDDSRGKFHIRFYLVALLFIIFDLEVALLFPWAINMEGAGVLGFIGVMIFLFILTAGFAYEWRKGALDWE